MVALKYFCREIDVRAGSDQPPLLSVSIHRGVALRSEFTEDAPRAETLDNYKLCEPGDIVLNRMRAFQGAIGVSNQRGIVSPDYLVLRPALGVLGAYLHFALRSQWFVGQMSSRIRGIGSAELGSVRTPRINASDLLDLDIDIPALPTQQRIADFLDDQVARIDAIAAARGRQISRLDDVAAAAAFHAVAGSEVADRKPSGLQWLGSIPADWPIAVVHAGYSVKLGKMLDENRFTGLHPMPYLRNTNVQWDRISTDDLKVMDIAPDERERFTVRAGDLLICEGGQPGRSAVWDGRIPEIGYQKALHRARPRDGNDVRWLQAFLRVAVQQAVFSTEFGQATIGHLTGEQLRSLRLPLPAPNVQAKRADKLQTEIATVELGRQSLGESVRLFEELRKSLITAAVTGDFDASSADGSRVPA